MVDPRDQLVLLVATFCALRTSEVLGLTWSSFQGDRLLIELAGNLRQVCSLVHPSLYLSSQVASLPSASQGISSAVLDADSDPRISPGLIPILASRSALRMGRGCTTAAITFSSTGNAFQPWLESLSYNSPIATLGHHARENDPKTVTRNRFRLDHGGCRYVISCRGNVVPDDWGCGPVRAISDWRTGPGWDR